MCVILQLWGKIEINITYECIFIITNKNMSLGYLNFFPIEMLCDNGGEMLHLDTHFYASKDCYSHIKCDHEKCEITVTCWPNVCSKTAIKKRIRQGINI
jgi:hypothetical protein